MDKFKLTKRLGDAPETGLQPPQLQFTDRSPKSVYASVAEWLFSSFPDTREEPTRISVPSSRALWLDENVAASAHAFMPPRGSREFAHLHADGSLHLVLHDAAEREVVAKGWGLHHPWKHRGVNEIMVFAPRDEREMEQIKIIVRAAYAHAIGSGPAKGTTNDN